MTAKRTAKQQKTTRSHAGGRWCRAFLAALSINGNVTLSAEKAGIDRVTAYRWREKHPAFAVQWDEALEESADRLEAEARRRAELGTLKPVWYRGEHVGDELEYSDQLMALMRFGWIHSRWPSCSAMA